MSEAKWKTWYPHQIDAWRGSMAIQSMSDGAYRGYHNLLMSQWQSDDGKLPGDDKMLARMSGLGARWKKFREEILENFESDENGRIFNARQMAEWISARDISEKKGRRHPESDQSQDRVKQESIQTLTRVKTHARVNVNVSVPVSTSLPENLDSEGNLDSYSPEMVARAVLVNQSLNGAELEVVLSNVVKAEILKGKTGNRLFEEMTTAWERYQEAKPKLSYISGAAKFFGEGAWKSESTWPWKDGHKPIREAAGGNQKNARYSNKAEYLPPVSVSKSNV